MILFVDDVEHRHVNFLSAFPEKDAEGVVWAGDPESACGALLQFDFSEIWLDHDAAPIMWNDGNNYYVPTFFVVAMFLVAMKFRGKVYIHTGNPAGASRMLNLLKSHGIAVERPDGFLLSKIWGGVHP